MQISKLLRIGFIISAITIAVLSPVHAKKSAIRGIEIVTLADIEIAEIALKNVAKLGNVWRDTENLIKSAKESLQKQEFRTARDLAAEALYQAELAYTQATKNKDLEFPEYLK